MRTDKITQRQCRMRIWCRIPNQLRSGLESMMETENKKPERLEANCKRDLMDLKGFRKAILLLSAMGWGQKAAFSELRKDVDD